MRLPPMNALRAFEAVARHGSFKRAADELFVTPAAVSHQIKSLEDFLGLPLFERTSRAIELTPAGSRCFPGVHAGFESIRTALAQAASVAPQSRLVISAGPAFVGRRLAPRLHAFAEANPAVLGRRVLATPDLQRGRLVAPFGTELKSGLWFHFVCPLAKRDDPGVVAFRDWLRTTLAESPDCLRGGARLRTRSRHVKVRMRGRFVIAPSVPPSGARR